MLFRPFKLDFGAVLTRMNLEGKERREGRERRIRRARETRTERTGINSIQVSFVIE